MGDATNTPRTEQDEIKAIQAEIETARAKREEIENRREAKGKITALRAELEAEKRAALEAEVQEKLEAEHGPLGVKIARVDTTEGAIFLRKPGEMFFRRFMDKGKTSHEDLLKLVRPSLLYPDKARFDAILEEVPAALLRCANAVCKLCGIGAEESAAKS